MLKLIFIAKSKPRGIKYKHDEVKVRLDSYGSKINLSKAASQIKNASNYHSYNLVLTDSSRYLEPAVWINPSTDLIHVPTLQFDRIVNRTTFLNSSFDVNENRFQIIKDPENWSKNKRVSVVKLDNGLKQTYVNNIFK